MAIQMEENKKEEKERKEKEKKRRKGIIHSSFRWGKK